jgi:hypothetical protein
MQEQAKRATELLAATNYSELFQSAIEGNHICHNALKEENLPISDGRVFLLNWQEATIDCQLTDVAAFVRRYARRSGREIPVADLLNMYGDVPRDIIYAMLLFPWPFVRAVHEYYAKKRAFTPVAFSSRMDEILTLQADYLEYIRSLSPDFVSSAASA